MNPQLYRSLQWGYASLDFLSLNIIFLLFENIFRQNGLITPNKEYLYFIFFLNLVWIMVAFTKDIYHERNFNSYEIFARASIHACLYFICIVIIALFFFRLVLLSRVFVTVVLSSIMFILLVSRFFFLGVLHYFKKQHSLVNKVLIIGYNSLAKQLVHHLTEEGSNKEIVGFCEELENVQELSMYPILANVSETLDVCKQYGVSEIYSTVAPEQNQSLYSLIQSADENCIRFKIVPDLGFFLKRQMHIDYLKGLPVISLRKEPLEDLGNRIKKRIFDIVVSLFVVVFILSWLIPIVGLLIWIESRGPIFFAQTRTGRNNKDFQCLKFRSMRQSKSADVTQATKNDSRVTRIGKFLRSKSLDEFPQFLNVLRGDMSIVGPRPHMLHHTNQYARVIGQYMVRQLLKPGITGWAQVNGFRGETRMVEQMQKRVEHDLWYLENWSLYLDIKIILMTVFNIVKGEKNAY